MLKSMTAIAVAAIAGAAMAQTGTATYTGQDFPFDLDQNRGGAFNWTLGGGLAGFGDNGGNTLKTFCVELRENTPGVGTTLAGQVNTVAIQGGDVPALQSETAYLFTQFKLASTGDFSGADFAQEIDQRAMQLAIWHFEENLGSFGMSGFTVANIYLQGLSASEQTDLLNTASTFILFADGAVDSGSWTGLGNVRVLNLGSGTGANPWGNQDMLIMIPLPGASAMAGLGLLAVGTRRRRTVG